MRLDSGHHFQSVVPLGTLLLVCGLMIICAMQLGCSTTGSLHKRALWKLCICYKLNAFG